MLAAMITFPYIKLWTIIVMISKLSIITLQHKIVPNILTNYMREIVMDNEKILAETTCQKHVVANDCYQWDETIKNPGQQCVENTNQYCLHGGTKYRC